jgi:hypothetical protein
MIAGGGVACALIKRFKYSGEASVGSADFGAAPVALH